MNKYICPVCGYDELEEAPRDETGRPSFDICDCCGVKFGYEDCTKKSIKKYRDKWIKEGCNWTSEELKPDEWNIEKQLKNIGINL
ncbi:hypothetical protein NNC19_05015 [Clostridium sp. SHJSY1]|uniref:hypothetical protein n=1 Tax=Clostridium sp. SHJSY1 TaxID=2942483 RepID=UPI00287482CC|nr:hypothetical protein [Clostridium sp. SHJSY1]MDS0525033.1 hypothetical protein [Clostridium sp. SHJSY1]